MKTHRSWWLLIASALGIASATALTGAISQAGLLPSASIANLNTQSPGQLDASFGISGVVTLSVRGDDWAQDVALQPDAKIVVVGAGYPATVTAPAAMVIARFDPYGSLDSAFGNSGVVTTGVPSGGAAARDVIVWSDGSLSVVGTYFSSGVPYVILARYLPDGGPDSTYGAGGVVTSSLRSDGNLHHIAAFQPDGKILVTGLSFDMKPAVARFTGSGALDAGFGSGGVVTASIGSLSSVWESIALQADGKILVGGSIYPSGGDRSFVLARYTAGGTPDTTFGVGGVVTTAVSLPGADELYALAIGIQADGKIILAGNFRQSTTFSGVLMRHAPDGGLDPTFGTNGVITLTVGGIDDEVVDIAFQPDQKILLVGRVATTITNTDLALMRFLPNGQPDPAFGLGGVATTDVDSDEVFVALALQPDGKVVAAGRTSSEFGPRRWVIARYAGGSFLYLPLILRASEPSAGTADVMPGPMWTEPGRQRALVSAAR